MMKQQQPIKIKTKKLINYNDNFSSFSQRSFFFSTRGPPLDFLVTPSGSEVEFQMVLTSYHPLGFYIVGGGPGLPSRPRLLHKYKWPKVVADVNSPLAIPHLFLKSYISIAMVHHFKK